MSKQTVLLTGASSGIGYELSKIFAKNRYDLILVARNKDKLEQIKCELEQFNVRISIFSKDLSLPHASRELYEEIKKQGQHVDILINNAGYGMTGKFTDLEWEKQLNMMHLNMIALTELTHLFVQDMINMKFGRIMNVGSIASFIATPSMSVYAASKAFVLSFSESLNTELKSKGDISVTALCPGPTKTNFAKVANVGELEHFFNRYGMTAKEVAQIGYRALIKKEPVIVPGLKFRGAVYLTRFIPRKLLQNLFGKSNQ